jgi:ribosome recycling factor
MASLLVLGTKAARGKGASMLFCQAVTRVGGGVVTPSSRATEITLSYSTSTPPEPYLSYTNHPSSFASSNSIGSIRLFGRKASRMGKHIESLDEMATSDSREEARNRREEKKKKSKKARMTSYKEPAAAATENDHDDGANDDNDDGDIVNVDEDGNQLLPESATVRSKMLMVIASIERSFSSIRGGEATPELFDAVRVSAYGETVPLSSVGQVVIEDAQRATISCYDPSVANDVRDAVRDMPGMNLNPYLEEGGSGVVIIPIPRVSEETRKEIVKELGRQAENGRQRIRKIRRTAMDIVKKGKDGKLGGVSKDDVFRVGKDVDSVTEEVLSVLNGIVEKKQKSVMED